MQRIHFVVTGRVQGVWFRDSTRREATRLGLTGYAKNLENGDVEDFWMTSSNAADTAYEVARVLGAVASPLDRSLENEAIAGQLWHSARERALRTSAPSGGTEGGKA